MAFTVHMKPSGHEFIVARGETILEAALRFGLSIGFNCTTGTCGSCKARVISGEVGETLHHDYVLSEAERSTGTVLMCCTMAASDMVVAATEVTGVSDIPHQQLTATVAKLELIADDIMVMEVRTPRSNTLQFLAGQHVTISLEGAPDRNKSIASCPCNGMVLQFHIHRTPGDDFADFVFSKLKLRYPVSLQGPFGRFVLDEESTRPIIFIAYETGFAPIKSVIEHAIALEFEQPMQLYWIVSDARGHYQANFCRSWQDALDDFRFVPISNETDWPGTGTKLNLSEQLTGLRKIMLQAAAKVVTDNPDLSGYDVYLNGPPEITVAAARLLLDHQLPETRLFVDQLERF
ncbi:MAG: 2Fe-2S iron-sulfur cluster-binding protein [Gammaproteobacteria bacterium]